MERTEINTLGEFGIIDRIAAKQHLKNTSSLKGIGDDAAVIDAGNGNLQLLTTDMLLEGVHFDLTYTPLRHLGYKAIVVGISDIVAMNGIAKQITVSIALSNRFSVEAIDELYEGIALACENYSIDLVGGDTTTSRGGLVISVTALGEVKKENITYRNGASATDILCVTGDLGAAYMGLQVLEREKQSFLAKPDMQPVLSEKAYLVGRQLKPEARTDIIFELQEKGIVPTSMIDISDGLASEVLHLCKASTLGIHIFKDNLPIENETMLTASEFNISPITAALNGGDDYELLMSINQKDYEKLKTITEITPIGYITTEKEALLVLDSGERIAITAQGWLK